MSVSPIIGTARSSRHNLLRALNIEARHIAITVICLPLILLCLYWPCLEGEFVYDDLETIRDNDYITGNTPLIDFFVLKQTSSPSTHLQSEIYRPLKNLSAYLDFKLWGHQTFGFHLTNLCLHLTACLLLLRLALMFKLSMPYIPAMMFCLHPAVSQNVAYISARADILALIFIFLTCLLFSKRYFFAGLISFILALCSKETAICLPLFLTLAAVARKELKTHVSKLITLWVISLFYFLFRSTLLGSSTQTEWLGGSFMLTMATQIKALCYYFFSVFYVPKLLIMPVIGIEESWYNLRSVSCLMFVTGLITFIFYFRKRLPQITLLGLLWFAVFLLPVMNILPIKAFLSWRFMYIPLPGLILALWPFIGTMCRHTAGRLVFYLWLGSLSLQTFLSATSFISQETLWRPVLKHYPHTVKPWRVMARVALERHNLKAATAYIEKGLAIHPKDSYLTWDRAKFHIAAGELEPALILLNRLDADLKNETGERVRDDLVWIYFDTGQFEVLLDLFRKTPDTTMFTTDSLLKIAHSAVFCGHSALARPLYEELLALYPIDSPSVREIREILKRLP